MFFSDAAGNRVVHQTREGEVVRVYNASGFYSPMQLTYWQGRLFVADSVHARVAAINVSSDEVHFSSSSPLLELNSCIGLVPDAGTGGVVVLDGWSMQSIVWTPAQGDGGDR